MKQRSCPGLLWFGLLLATFSQAQYGSKPRRLCGRHLMTEIVKICGQTDWSQFEMEGQTPMKQLAHQSSQKVKTFSPEQIPTSAWGRFTDPVPAGASQEKAVNIWELQPLPKYPFEKVNLRPKSEFSSHDVIPYGESAKLQKKSTDKIKTLSALLWGRRAQRKRRGYSEKCCLKGCTKEELAVACLPYIDF
ncbi:insulin-like peptide INSL6 [Psammomys obesus]|uniref:insulin-like peptide INSL6 n=1 Tax=Psammomys obesus TaxID=48139 RepID=UPI002452841A|nr:insulin-like peptide INSL6 [Psammomys obesus]